MAERDGTRSEQAVDPTELLRMARAVNSELSGTLACVVVNASELARRVGEEGPDSETVLTVLAHLEQLAWSGLAKTDRAESRFREWVADSQAPVSWGS